MDGTILGHYHGKGCAGMPDLPGLPNYVAALIAVSVFLVACELPHSVLTGVSVWLDVAQDVCCCFGAAVGVGVQCWRYERMTRGRRREHYQWNMDIVGVPGEGADWGRGGCERGESDGISRQSWRLKLKPRVSRCLCTDCCSSSLIAPCCVINITPVHPLLITPQTQHRY